MAKFMKQQLPHVIFIDSGVDSDIFGISLLNDLEVDAGGVLRNRVGTIPCNINHGTTCAGIVKKYCSRFLCSSIKVLNDSNWKCSIDSLLAAIKWCSGQNADIVNISLGSTAFQDREKLLPAINRLARKSLVVAAHSNRNIATYPASFSSVVGVIANDETESPSFINCSFGGINVTAPSVHTLTTNYGQSFITEHANSCAASYITALACNDLLEGKSISINNFLARFMHKIYPCHNNILHIRPDWISNGLLVSDTPFDTSDLKFEVMAKLIIDNQMLPSFENLQDYTFVDTVIFLWREENEKQMKRLMLHLATDIGKDLVIITPPTSPLAPKPSNCKVWSPYNWNPIYLGTSETVLKTPVIVILDESENRLLEICRYISNEFRILGYHVPFSTNCPLSVLFEGFYVSDCSQNVFEHLIQMEHVYQADAHIFGLKTNKKSLLHHLESFSQVAIDIVVTWGKLGMIDINLGEVHINLSISRITMSGKYRSSINCAKGPLKALFNTICDCLEYPGNSCV